MKNRFQNVKLSGYYMYRQNKVQHFYVRPTDFILFFYGCEKEEILFPYTTLTELLYNRDIDMQYPVVTICTAVISFNIPTFCPLIVFMCFVWI